MRDRERESLGAGVKESDTFWGSVGGEKREGVCVCVCATTLAPGFEREEKKCCFGLIE